MILPLCTLEGVASLENLTAAARLARRGKSRRPDVEDFFVHRETNLLRLHEQLRDGTWRPGEYHLFTIREPKRRLIAAAPFADRVVHHAMCRLMAPRLERRFIARSFSCQIGKGTTAARDCVRRMVNARRYVLKCDVRKFFDSIPHAILQERLWRHLRCAGIREIIRYLLASYAATPGRGLPIGNLTSQLWGNFILDDMDHWITEAKGHGEYARYTDDFLLFSDDKAALWSLREGIMEQLHAVGLTLAEPKSRLLACREGVPFCGFRFLPGQQPRVLGATKRRFEHRRRRLREAGDFRRLTVSTLAWYQFSREGNTTGLRRSWSQRQAHTGISPTRAAVEIL